MWKAYFSVTRIVPKSFTEAKSGKATRCLFLIMERFESIKIKWSKSTWSALLLKFARVCQVLERSVEVSLET